MLKRDLVDGFAKQKGITRNESREIIEEIFELIRTGLKENGQVKLTGFGTFEAVERESRTAKNPQTGKPMEIPSGMRIRYKASKKLREEVSEAL